MKKAIIAYIPVLHQGYLSFIERHSVDRIYLATTGYISSLDKELGDILSRDIRSIEPSIIAMVLGHKYRIPVSLLEDSDFTNQEYKYILPREDVSQVVIAKNNLKNYDFDHTFLRWDWGKTHIPKEITGEYTISTEEKDRYMMAMARLEVEKSSDFWRQVGAAVEIGNTILTAYNRHYPDDMSPYVYGDPRLYMKPGEKPDVCGALHAEKSIISQISARKELSSKGASIYVTTYPCSDCARALVEAGFKKLFFGEGYSNLDAAEVLKDGGVEVVQVK